MARGMHYLDLEGGALGAPPSASVAASLTNQRPGASPSSGPLPFCLYPQGLAEFLESRHGQRGKTTECIDVAEPKGTIGAA